MKLQLAKKQRGCVHGSRCPPKTVPAPETLPQCRQPLTKQGEEIWGRTGPPAASSTSLVCSTRAIFCSTGGASLRPSPDCRGLEEAEPDIYFLGHVLTESVPGAPFKLDFLSSSFAAHAAGWGICKRSSAAGDIQSCLGATCLLSQSCPGLRLWATERGSEQTFWGACVRKDVRGRGEE